MKIAQVYYLKRKPVNKQVFILCSHRTGSNLLMSYLDPKATIYHEILSRHQPHGLRTKFISKKAVFRHLRHFANYHGDSICAAKIFFEDLKIHGILPEELFAEFPKAKWIILYRKNILNQYLSHELALKTMLWTQHQRDLPRSENTRLEFSPEMALEYRDKTRQCYEEIVPVPDFRKQRIWISYEELAGDAQKLFDEALFPFLELSPYPVRTNLMKQTNRQHPETILNHEKVESFIRHADFTQSYNRYPQEKER